MPHLSRVRPSLVASCAALAAVVLTACGSTDGSGSGAAAPTAGTGSSAATAAPSTADGIAGDTSSPGTTPSAPAPSGTTSSAPTSSSVPSAATSSAPTRPAPPAGFVGTWYGHGRGLTISSTGAVDVTFRLYVTCTDSVTTGCDRVDGNGIVDGGHATGYVSSVTNDTTVRVTITSSTAPKDIPLGTVKIGHDVGHHALAVFTSTFQDAPFCGTGAPSGYCGA